MIIKEKHRECKCFFQFFSCFSLISDKKRTPLSTKFYTNCTIDIVYSNLMFSFSRLTQNKYCEFRPFVFNTRTCFQCIRTTFFPFSAFCIQYLVLTTLIETKNILFRRSKMAHFNFSQHSFSLNNRFFCNSRK